MTGTNDLTAIAAQLEYAAGPGIHRLEQKVLGDGRTSVNVDAAVRAPGPGLVSLVKRRRAETIYAGPVNLPPILDSMNTELVDGGLGLALGDR